MTVTAEIFIDLCCPWCLIGVTRFENVLQNFGNDITVDVSYRPFLLDRFAPAEGVNIHEKIRQKHHVEPKTLFAQVESQAHASAIPLDLSLVPLAYQTIPAHALIRHARAKESQRALVVDLLNAYFLKQRNISDIAVLTEIAGRHSFEPSETRAILDDPREHDAIVALAGSAATGGVNGVPFFVFDGRRKLYGGQPEAALRAVILAA